MYPHKMGYSHQLSRKPQSNLKISEVIKEETTEIKTNTHLDALLTIVNPKSLVFKTYF